MIRSTVQTRTHPNRGSVLRRAASRSDGSSVPNKLISPDSQGASSLKYTLRICTGGGRGEGAEGEAVQLAVVGRNGSAFLRRLPVLPEESATSARLFDRGNYDTARRVPSPAGWLWAHSPPQVTFEGPDVRPVASMLLAPESGTWTVEEASLSWPGDASPQRFVPRLGRSSAQGAELLPAAPPKSPEEVEALRAASMRDYRALKSTLVGATAAIVAAGTAGVFAATGESDFAVPFAVGGAVGLTYLGFLQNYVDVIGGGGDEGGARGGGAGGGEQTGGRSGVAATAARLGVTFLLLALGAKYIASGGLVGEDGVGVSVARGRLAAGAAGFFCYRLAVATVAIALEVSSRGASPSTVPGAEAGPGGGANSSSSGSTGGGNQENGPR